MYLCEKVKCDCITAAEKYCYNRKPLNIVKCYFNLIVNLYFKLFTMKLIAIWIPLF